MKFSIISIIFILLNIYITFSQDTDEKYYFKGNFGTSTLTTSKSNLIKGTSDVLITRSEGSYKFYYNITLTGLDGNNIFQTKIMGPSAPNKDDGQLKLTLSYSDDSTSTLVSFKGTGQQTLAFNSPAANLVAATLTGLASDNDKSNYANEQFYVIVITKTDGTAPVTRAQLLYTGSSNLPIEGGGENPNGSSNDTTTSSTASSTTSSSTTPSSDSDSKTDTASSSSPSSSSSATTNGNLNPGGVETSTSSPSPSSSSKTDDSSIATTSVLPTLLIASLFVLTLVIMS